MKIYTKTGDEGLTGLFGGGRVRKDDPRVEAYGEVDELNAVLGVARSAGSDPELDGLLQTVQDQLFTVGAVLATPQGSKADAHIPHVRPSWTTEMESTLDRLEAELAPLQSFILPGGSAAASALHLARTVCRRAERRVVSLVDPGIAPRDVLVYMNRLSDYLFTLARVANHRAQVRDVPWIPHKD